MRLLFAFFFSCLSITPAFCDQKEEGLANCLWEVERTMVLYRAIYEGGYSGKLETDAFEQLDKELQRTPAGSERYQSLKRLKDGRAKEANDREANIKNKLMDRCMNVRGYRYIDDPKVTKCVRPDYSRGFDWDSDCWVGK
jgi:hypothetical protein